MVFFSFFAGLFKLLVLLFVVCENFSHFFFFFFLNLSLLSVNLDLLGKTALLGLNLLEYLLVHTISCFPFFFQLIVHQFRLIINFLHQIIILHGELVSLLHYVVLKHHFFNAHCSVLWVFNFFLLNYFLRIKVLTYLLCNRRYVLFKVGHNLLPFFDLTFHDLSMLIFKLFVLVAVLTRNDLKFLSDEIRLLQST